MRYWNGIGVTAANLAAMKKTDLTAGIPPPWRADRLVCHNDKLLAYRNVSGSSQSSYGYHETSSRVSTTLTAASLIDTSSTWVATDDYLNGWRCYPCVNDVSGSLHYPLKYWIITDHAQATETVTCGGANMTSYAATGDGYLIAKFYKKSAFHCDEVEPANWLSTSVLQFNDEDGDVLQCMLSWNGRMVVVCRDQLWVVSGYGPTSPWSKQMLSPRGGTLSPWSVVDAGDQVMWLGSRGVMSYGGGYQRPVVLSDQLRSIVLDINESAREQAVGIQYKGLVLWSYPSADSNVNDRTLIYNPETTAFMKNCIHRGATVMNGKCMLQKQAEAAWEIFHQNL
jgi:hypothetical protein